MEIAKLLNILPKFIDAYCRQLDTCIWGNISRGTPIVAIRGGRFECVWYVMTWDNYQSIKTGFAQNKPLPFHPEILVDSVQPPLPPNVPSNHQDAIKVLLENPTDVCKILFQRSISVHEDWVIIEHAVLKRIEAKLNVKHD